MSETTFPALVVHADRLEAKGSFAEAQAEYLDPDPRTVEELEALVRQKNAGIVAHYYMAPELQGVLARLRWPHVHISDSLLMADKAVAMVDGSADVPGAERIVVLGVDFMSENARAMLDKGGRAQDARLPRRGRSDRLLARRGGREHTLRAFLDRGRRGAARAARRLHQHEPGTKAEAHARCPRSPARARTWCRRAHGLRRGARRRGLLRARHVHGPEPRQALPHARRRSATTPCAPCTPPTTWPRSSASLPRFHCFDEGHCIVHHMFGAEVAERVRTSYPHAFVTAHLEVPGEMFELGPRARGARAAVWSAPPRTSSPSSRRSCAARPRAARAPPRSRSCSAPRRAWSPRSCAVQACLSDGPRRRRVRDRVPRRERGHHPHERAEPPRRARRRGR
jgi:quinolinate synthase